MLVVGDIFCVVVVEQLQVWGECNCILVIVQYIGVDFVLVIFDVVQVVKVCGIDVLIVDIVGCLYIKDNLMEELKKVCWVIGKLDEMVFYEVLLVFDVGIGQNVINQVKQFNFVVELIGLVLIKLDGIVKGGVIFVLVKQFGLLICYIGVGEGIDDFCIFEVDVFVQVFFVEWENV